MRKKASGILLCALLMAAALLVSGCGDEAGGTVGLDEGQTSIFHEIGVDGGDPITVYFDVYLNQTDAPFLYIEAAEDVKAVMDYSYTKDDGDISVWYGKTGEEENTEIQLESGTVAEQKDGQTSIELKKGGNVFWITSHEDQNNCEMNISIQVEKPSAIVSARLNEAQ